MRTPTQINLTLLGVMLLGLPIPVLMGAEQVGIPVEEMATLTWVSIAASVVGVGILVTVLILAKRAANKTAQQPVA